MHVRHHSGPRVLLTAESLSVRFQPIIKLGNRGLHAVEALVRGPRGSHVESADRLFSWARRHRVEASLDRTCLKLAIKTAAAAGLTTDLSLNVHPSTVSDHSFFAFFVDLLAANDVAPERIILEIVEHSKVTDFITLCNRLDELRALRVRVALDDVGAGHSNLRMLIECRPDYLKMDRCIVQGCYDSPYRRAVLESTVTLGEKLGSRVVAEGIEMEEDLSGVMSCGIGLAQGFLFSAAVPAEELHAAIA